MQLLSQAEHCLVAGGYVSFSGNTITVTGESQMYLNGLRFASNGIIYYGNTTRVFHDFTQDKNAYCFEGDSYSAAPVNGGYQYVLDDC